VSVGRSTPSIPPTIFLSHTVDGAYNVETYRAHIYPVDFVYPVDLLLIDRHLATMMLGKDRPRLHTTPRQAPSTSRSKWLQDVTGLREGEEREPPALSPQEKLEELKHQVFKNRYNDEVMVRCRSKNHRTDPTIDTRTTTKKQCDPASRKLDTSTKKGHAPNVHSPLSKQKIEKNKQGSKNLGAGNPKPLVAAAPTPFQPNVSEQPSPQQSKWLLEAKKCIDEAKAKEAATPPSSDPLTVPPRTQLDITLVASELPKTGMTRRKKKGVSWLRKALTTLEVTTRTAARNVPDVAPTKYTKLTSPLQQELWLSEIQIAMTEAKVAEELYSRALEGLQAKSPSSVAFVEERETELPRPNLPDYYAGDHSEQEGVSVDDDDDESVSSIQVLLNWCWGEVPVAPRQLNIRETMVAVTE